LLAVVLRGGNEVQWRGSQSIRRGTIEVVVHPPVDTSHWQAETMGRHTDEVRELFVETLAHWPGRPAPPTPAAVPTRASVRRSS
jgi:putative phosphoserine phosphatase/1-acylglycerol-3-phosphate O-acyltransferase